METGEHSRVPKPSLPGAPAGVGGRGGESQYVTPFVAHPDLEEGAPGGWGRGEADGGQQLTITPAARIPSRGGTGRSAVGESSNTVQMAKHPWPHVGSLIPNPALTAFLILTHRSCTKDLPGIFPQRIPLPSPKTPLHPPPSHLVFPSLGRSRSPAAARLQLRMLTQAQGGLH